jgi:hypothetical protein
MSAGWGSRMRPVDHDLPLAPLHLLAGVVASRAAALGGLDALAVEHRGRGRLLAADPLAISHDEQVVDRLEQAVVRYRLNQPKTVLRGGRSLGRSRPVTPPRRR